MPIFRWRLDPPLLHVRSKEGESCLSRFILPCPEGSNPEVGTAIIVSYLISIGAEMVET